MHLIEDAFLRLDSLDAQRLIDGYVALGGNQACSDQVSYDLGLGHRGSARAGHGRARHRGADRVRGAGTAGRAAARPRSHGADLWPPWRTRPPRRTIERLRSGACSRSASRTARSRRPAARCPGWPAHPVTGISCRAMGDQLHLSGFPDSAAARRAARVIAARRRADGLLLDRGARHRAKVDGPMSRRCGELSSGRPRASTRRVRRRRSQSGVLGAYAAALGAYAGLVRGDRSRLAEFESALARLPAVPLPALDMNSRSSISATGSASCCSTTAGRATQSGTSGASTRTTTSTPPRPSCTSAGSPKPVDVRRKR